MLITAALHDLLAFVLAGVLAKDIWLELIILDGRLEVIEAKQPKKVSRLL